MMQLVSFVSNGESSYGIHTDAGIVDAGARLGHKYADLRAVLVAGALGELQALVGEPPDLAVDDISYLPPIGSPASKFLCIGINYMPHILEMGRERPDYPVIFVRFADSIVGHGQGMVLPGVSEQYDYEGELAVVIGRQARHVAAADAMNYVAAYGCFNDGSVRDYQRHAQQWTPGKNFHHSGAFGPWIVTADDCPPPAKMHLTTRLNGEVVQDESVAELCFDIPALIEYITTWTQLEPGDVIVSGTPGGVGAGRTPPLWMQAGDKVEVEITGVGTLRNEVVTEGDVQA